MSSKVTIRYCVVDQFKDFNKYELVLKLKPFVKTEELVECIECVLSGVWFGSDLKVNEIIHVLDAKHDIQTNQSHVNNDYGFIVKSPDVLISSTTLMAANYCMRKSWLSQKYSGWTQTNRPMLIGNIVHQLFQDSCRRSLHAIQEIRDLFETSIDDFINDFYSIGITRSQVLEEVSLYIPSIAEWMDKYLHNMSAIEDTESVNNFNTNQNKPKLQVLKVLDIEDSVWSTKWGLKGVIDLTVKVSLNEDNIQNRFVMPLELKTGKASFSAEHIGQVGLYSIMLEERDRTYNNQGLLLYLKDKPQMRQIVTKRAVKRDLIQLRNEFVKHVKNVEIGPKPLNNYRICCNCDHLLDCCLGLQTIETQNLNDSNVMSEELIPRVLSHLSENDLNFFKKWISLLNLELIEVNERDIDSKVGFWTQSSAEREAKGLGFGKLKLLTPINDSAVFVRSDKFSNDFKDFNLSDHVMRRWERVTISIDHSVDTSDSNSFKRIALSMGFIKSITEKEIEVILDKRVNTLPSNALFRIDHLLSTGMISTNYTNLLRLMDSDNNRSQILRRIIIDKQRVEFSNKLKRKIVTKGKQILKTLNKKQQKAILKALSTDSYLLLRGMPGAGKTQTIIALIRLLVALDQTVLITSYTHSAVDNILLKLKDHSIDFLRIGSEKRVNPYLHSYTVSAKTRSFTDVAQLESYYSGVKVVASTCLGVSGHSIFNKRTFDYCIVDEASQVLLPTCLGPLFHSNRFLLVGDPKQLPPVVQCVEARLLGLEQSLFDLLQSESNTTDLTIQYRMNSEIMRICNQLTYNGVLKCASLEVCNQTLNPNLSYHYSHNNWLSEVIRTDLCKSVIFIDTDAIPAPEVRDIKGKVYNESEAKIAQILVKHFLKYIEITAQQMAVISPYQRQVRFLRQTIDVEGLEINTVDQFQGRDKEVVIFSCVRSKCNESNSKSEILSDERRLNVALSRAKHKLVLIGSQTNLIHFIPFFQLFSTLRSDQILSLTSTDYEMIL